MTNLKGPIYVSGPMSHYPDYNFPAFRWACLELRGRGFEVLSPHENGQPGPEISPNDAWIYYMRLDIQLITKANLVVVLTSWECSRRARYEVEIAHALHIPVLPIGIALSIIESAQATRGGGDR